MEYLDYGILDLQGDSYDSEQMETENDNLFHLDAVLEITNVDAIDFLIENGKRVHEVPVVMDNIFYPLKIKRFIFLSLFKIRYIWLIKPVPVL